MLKGRESAMMDETCHKHEGVKAVGICRSCGKPFCGDCLSQGLEALYCSGEECRAQMRRDDAFIGERDAFVEAEIQAWLQSFDTKLTSVLVGLWLIATPLFVYLGSDGWTANFGVASAMGPLGALVLCLQLRTFAGMYKRRQVKRRRAELKNNRLLNELSPEKASDPPNPAASL